MTRRKTEKSERALVVGSTGIVGQNLSRRLLEQGWAVLGLSRGAQVVEGVQGLAADLRDARGGPRALAGVDPTDLFLSAWIRHDTEAENVGSTAPSWKRLRRPRLRRACGTSPSSPDPSSTWTLRVLRPRPAAETPFREDNPRLPGLNFYYTQEDVVFREAASGDGFGWTVHRPHTIVGYAVGNAMNMGSTLAVYASLCRERAAPSSSPARSTVERADRRDRRPAPRRAPGVGRDHPGGPQPGLQHRQRRHLPLALALAPARGLLRRPLEGPPEGLAPLEPRRPPRPPSGLSSPPSTASPSRTSTTSSLVAHRRRPRPHPRGVNDMTKSRRLGFLRFQETPASFFDLFTRLKAVPHPGLTASPPLRLGRGERAAARRQPVLKTRFIRGVGLA